MMRSEQNVKSSECLKKDLKTQQRKSRPLSVRGDGGFGSFVAPSNLHPVCQSVHSKKKGCERKELFEFSLFLSIYWQAEGCRLWRRRGGWWGLMSSLSRYRADLGSFCWSSHRCRASPVRQCRGLCPSGTNWKTQKENMLRFIQYKMCSARKRGKCLQH